MIIDMHMHTDQHYKANADVLGRGVANKYMGLRPQPVTENTAPVMRKERLRAPHSVSPTPETRRATAPYPTWASM